jgi:hypothetical protein
LPAGVPPIAMLNVLAAVAAMQADVAEGTAEGAHGNPHLRKMLVALKKHLSSRAGRAGYNVTSLATLARVRTSRNVRS